MSLADPDGDPGADAAFRAADDAFARGDWDEALRLFLDRLVAFIARLHAGLPLRPADLAALDRVADLAVLNGRPDLAEDARAGGRDLCVKHGLTFGADYLDLNRAVAAVGAGRWALCGDLLHGVLAERFPPPGCLPALLADPARREPDWLLPYPRAADRAVLYTRYYYVVGRWLASRGHLHAAAAALTRGADLARPPAPALACRAFTPLVLARAGVRTELGELDRAEADLRLAGPGLDPVRRPAAAISWWEETGRVALYRGEYGRALDAFGRAADVYRRAGLGRALLPALLNQAEVLVLVNQVSVAEELLAEVAAGRPDPPTAARAAGVAVLARLRVGDGFGKDAPPPVSAAQGRLVRAAPPRLPAAPPVPPTAEAADDTGFLAWFDRRALGVRLAVDRADVPAARAGLAELHRLLSAGVDSPLIAARMRALDAEVRYHEKDWAGAREGSEAALGQLDALGLKPEAWQAARYLGWCAGRLGSPEADRRRLTDEDARRLGELARSLPPEQMRVYLLNKWTVEERELAAEAAELQRVGDAVPRGRPSARWVRFARQAHQFLSRLDGYHLTRNGKQLAGNTPAGDWGPAGPPRGWLRWLLGHPRDRVTLSFLVLPDRVVVVRAGWLSVTCRTRYVTRLRVRTEVARWHQAALSRNEAAAAAAAGKLADALGLDDLLGGLPRRVTRLTVVADDSLHGVPFAALPLGGATGDRPPAPPAQLIDRFAVTLAVDHLPRPAPPRPRGRRPLALGVARAVGPAKLAGGTARVSFDRLPGVPAETRRVSRWLGRWGGAPEVMTDTDGPPADVLSAWRSAGLVHAACHGVFVADRPDASGLVLGAGPGPPGGPVLRTLSLRELHREDLTGLRHVTLSSCWGADNFVVPGRWVISLPEALLRAGAGSVLANLWEVYDEVAPFFVGRFYKYALRHPRDVAVRLAQLDVRAGRGRCPPGGRTRRASPLLWAGYQLYGDPSRLRKLRYDRHCPVTRQHLA